jgi:protein TonB
MSLAFDTASPALWRTSAPAQRPLISRRMAGALCIAAAVHAVIGFAVWEAKFQPHYEPATAEVIEARLVQPPPPPPPPPQPPPKREAHRTPRPAPPHPAPPRPTLRPRPPRALTDIAPPQQLPVAPAPTPAAAPSPPVLAAPAPPAPPKPPERQHVITNPDWLREPNGDDLARYYPEQAQRQGVAGQATIDCAVSEAGGLVDCNVAAESPKASGFGRAALKMAGDFRMRPMTRDGVPVAGGRIRIPIRFVMPDAA